MKRVWWWLIGGALVVVLMVAVSQYDWTDESKKATGERYEQRSGESMAGKYDTPVDKPTADKPATDKPSAEMPSEDARAREITGTAGPLTLSAEQREKIRARIAGPREERVDTSEFTLTIGSAVPRHVQLHRLPVELADVLGGYHGSEYLIVRDQLVIVDPQARRIVALVPGV
jgi:hypothetical protein